MFAHLQAVCVVAGACSGVCEKGGRGRGERREKVGWQAGGGAARQVRHTRASLPGPRSRPPPYRLVAAHLPTGWEPRSKRQARRRETL